MNDNSMEMEHKADSMIGDSSARFSDLPGGGRTPAATQDQAPKTEQKAVEMLMDVSLQVMVELGRTRMTLRQILDLQKGSVVELNRVAGDVVDIYVNDKMVARGEVVVVDDKFGVRITELISRKADGAN